MTSTLAETPLFIPGLKVISDLVCDSSAFVSHGGIIDLPKNLLSAEKLQMVFRGGETGGKDVTAAHCVQLGLWTKLLISSLDGSDCLRAETWFTLPERPSPSEVDEALAPQTGEECTSSGGSCTPEQLRIVAQACRDLADCRGETPDANRLVAISYLSELFGRFLLSCRPTVGSADLLTLVEAVGPSVQLLLQHGARIWKEPNLAADNLVAEIEGLGIGFSERCMWDGGGAGRG